MGLWLNGEKLVRGVDYTSVSGSTRITIKSQTLQEKAYTDDTTPSRRNSVWTATGKMN